MHRFLLLELKNDICYRVLRLAGPGGFCASPIFVHTSQPLYQFRAGLFQLTIWHHIPQRHLFCLPSTSRSLFLQIKKNTYISLPRRCDVCPIHLVLLDIVTLTFWWKCKLRSFLLYNFVNRPASSHSHSVFAGLKRPQFAFSA